MPHSDIYAEVMVIFSGERRKQMNNSRKSATEEDCCFYFLLFEIIDVALEMNL